MKELFLCVVTLYNKPLSTSRCATSLADQASFLIYESFISAIGTFLSFGTSTICYIFFQCSFYTIFPCVNVFTVKLQRIYQFDNTINRHSPTKYTRNQFSIVPIFFVELFGQTFNGCFVSTFVFKLEIISFVAFFINVFDDASGSDRFGQ